MVAYARQGGSASTIEWCLESAFCLFTGFHTRATTATSVCCATTGTQDGQLDAGAPGKGTGGQAGQDRNSYSATFTPQCCKFYGAFRSRRPRHGIVAAILSAFISLRARVVNVVRRQGRDASGSTSRVCCRPTTNLCFSLGILLVLRNFAATVVYGGVAWPLLRMPPQSEFWKPFFTKERKPCSHPKATTRRDTLLP